MKRLTCLSTIIILLLSVNLFAAEMGSSLGQDLDQLWAQAQQNFDTQQEDCILLLESLEVSLNKDQSLSTRVHRVVWIGTAVGVRRYADLRVPWNSATSELKVEKLRTWREGRWWPDAEQISETAVVHTLPYAVNRADDYTAMRETMLLHDGVELGCIMETVYTITEQKVPAAGGLFIFAQDDPAVRTQLKISGAQIKSEEINGAVEWIAQGGQQKIWTSSLTQARRQPATGSPQSIEPTVAWTLWSDWNSLAENWLKNFERAQILESRQTDLLQKVLHPALSTRQRAVAVGDFLNQKVRPIHYDTGFWTFAPRSAVRTLDTAYGHDLDRAVLAAALLGVAGFTVDPMFIGQGSSLVAPDIPRLQDIQRIILRLRSGSGLWFDPASGTVISPDEIMGHAFWDLHQSGDNRPQTPTLPQSEMSFTVGLNLSPGEDDLFKGEGYFRGTAAFSQHGETRSPEGLKDGFVSPLSESILPGLKPASVLPGSIEPAVVELDFTLQEFEIPHDGLDRKSLVLSAPLGGILDTLPQGVHLYDEKRDTPVHGMKGWHQTVTLRLETSAADLKHIPQAFKLANDVGLFELQIHQNEDCLTLIRTLVLTQKDVMAEQWPQLRALLLAELDPAHGTVIWN